jgi:ERCC4-type nuclease
MLTVDDREVTQHPEIPQMLTIPVTVQRLDSADYAFLDRNNEPVGIERCEIGNLMQKIRNGELEAQLARCDNDYKTVMLLIEGVYDHVSGFVAQYRKTRDGNTYYRNRIEPSFRYTDVKALLTRMSELGIELVETPTFECSLMVIETIYRQRKKSEDEHTLFKKLRQVKIPVKMSTNPAVPMLLALCPRMPDKVAIKLLGQFGSIWNVINAEPKELLNVEGMGKGLVSKLLQGIGKL